MHVFMQHRNELRRFYDLKAEVHGVRDAFVMVMAGRVELHVLGELRHLLCRPRLVRRHAAPDDAGLRFRPQEKPGWMRKHRIHGSVGSRLPDALQIR
jgi:hypothetical protein